MTHRETTHSASGAPAELAPELAAERALRLAAGCGNGLLSGAVVEILAGEALSTVLRSALSRMGARLLGTGGSLARGPADYVFVDGEIREPELAVLMGERLRDVTRLPAIFVCLGESPDLDALESALGSLSVTSGAELPADATRSRALRWRRREPRAQVAEFRLDGRAVALAIPASELTVPDARTRISESAARIEWAGRGMPATAGLARSLAETGAIRGTRVGVSLVLEPKTAALAIALRDAGAEVAVFSADGETDPAVATALAELGVEVFAPKLGLDPVPADQDGADTDTLALDAAHAAGILDWAPELLIDDGSHLVRLAHTERPGALERLRAASEETTSGVRPLIEMAAEGALCIPVIAVNDARTKSEFDNRIGTGQSCVFAIADLLDSAARPGHDAAGAGATGIGGTRWVVVGYGPVGAGVARFAAALGAKITVVERDPVRALQALHDGFEASTLASALPIADVAVSATGVWHTLSGDDLARLRPGAAVAVAGGIDDELALDELRERGWQAEHHGPHLATWRAPGEGGGPLVLADGAGVNYTAGEGNPIEVMDLSFATQLSSLGRIAEGLDAVGVHVLDAAAERRVAAAALQAHGGEVDPLGSGPVRPGGAAQHWTAHRYRATDSRG